MVCGNCGEDQHGARTSCIPKPLFAMTGSSCSRTRRRPKVDGHIFVSHRAVVEWRDEGNGSIGSLDDQELAFDMILVAGK